MHASISSAAYLTPQTTASGMLSQAGDRQQLALLPDAGTMATHRLVPTLNCLRPMAASWRLNLVHSRFHCRALLAVFWRAPRAPPVSIGVTSRYGAATYAKGGLFGLISRNGSSCDAQMCPASLSPVRFGERLRGLRFGYGGHHESANVNCWSRCSCGVGNYRQSHT